MAEDDEVKRAIVTTAEVKSILKDFLCLISVQLSINSSVIGILRASGMVHINCVLEEALIPARLARRKSPNVRDLCLARRMLNVFPLKKDPQVQRLPRAPPMID